MSDAVQQIKDRLNIVDVVGRYVELHKAGRHFKGKSPFSNERTPSFYVSPERGMYYCFSTNQGGDIFTFIQHMEGLEFKDALRQLAEEANVELTQQSPEARSARDRLYETTAVANEYYCTQLDKTEAASAYLHDRGVHPHTVRTWGIGYAPGPPLGGWRDLRTYMHSRGYTDTDLFAVGLIKQPDAGKEPFDVFRDRLVFPVADTQGRVVAFSGRILHPNDKAPKYVNSPETELYKKSELLFGYDKAKHSIRKLPFWLIVEGQFDVVMAHQMGYTNTVAVSGTALTLQHVQQLERLCTQVVLALDADRAGIAAMQKAATVMLARGIDLKVAALPEGKDPADLVLSEPAKLKHCIAEATHVIDFLLGHLRTQARDERTYKLRVREEVLPYITLIPNKIDQDHFMHKVAEQIGGSVDAVRHEVTRLLERSEREPDSSVSEKSDTTPESERPNSSDRLDELQAYILATTGVIPEMWTARLQEMLQVRLGQTIERSDLELSDQQLERYRFQLEEQLATLTLKQQAEEVVDRLNQLVHTKITRSLRRSRGALEEAELIGDEDTIQQVLQEHQYWQRVRAKEPFTSEALLGDAPLD